MTAATTVVAVESILLEKTPTKAEGRRNAGRTFARIFGRCVHGATRVGRRAPISPAGDDARKRKKCRKFASHLSGGRS